MMINRIYIILLCLIWQTLSLQAQIVDTVCASAKGEVYKVLVSPGSNYSWSIEGGTILYPQTIGFTTSDSIVVNWGSKPGKYRIKVVERNAFGCRGDTMIAEVVINENKKVFIVGPTDICFGETVLLNAEGAKYFKWNTGQTQSQIVVKPDKNTEYYVIGYGNNCNPDTAKITVNVHAKPKADFTFSPKKPGIGETVNFIAKATGASQYKWYFDGSDNVSGTFPQMDHVFSGYGEKHVKLIVTNKAGCMDTISYKVVIDDEIKIFVPSAFTPNGDQQNDIFVAVSNGAAEYHMDVFNRWGEKVFETDDIEKGWDGTFKGTKVPEGVFYYQLKIKGINKRDYYINGQVTVIY